ncbi:MAG TPA: inositol monophosphatase family protein [Gemmataceae bacterium]|jgi:3'(2'), 5'-bisphosphate nucleotidase|nr:inositol monophosphatase family protein [Gemmataceae bacterium]
MDYTRELTAALQAAERAGRNLLERYSRFKMIPDAPASISTEADRASQEIVLTSLRDQFPGDAFCAEEETPALAAAVHTGPRLWIVDPIDGTRGFARKNGEFSVMVAFVHEGRMAAGVVLEPAHHRLTYAARGQGCWRRDGDAEPVPCRVSATPMLAEATLTQSHSRDPAVPSTLVRALSPARVVETYSAGIKLALVARAEADLYLNTYDAFHDWDICAGHILVDEAGGTVSGLAGQTLLYGLAGAWQRHGLLASNGVLHQAALAAMGSVE